MTTRRVVGPNGTEWTVRRKWVPRRLTWRGRSVREIDVVDGVDLAFAADDLPIIGVIGVVIAGVILSFFAVAFLLPAIIFLLELLLIVMLVSLGVLARLLFRRPWTVEARQPQADHAYEWKVIGWQASGERVDAVADLLQATDQPTDGVRVPPVPPAPA